MPQFDARELSNQPAEMMAGFGQGYNLAQTISGKIRAGQEANLADEQRRAGIDSVLNDGSPKNIMRVSLENPDLAAPIKASFANMDTASRQQKVKESIPLYAAALNGRGDIAARSLEQKADLLEQSGATPDEIDGYRMRAKQAREDIGTFKTEVGLWLSEAMGSDNFAKSFAQFQQSEAATIASPYERAKLSAEANKAQAAADMDAAKAPYAAATAEAELEAKQLSAEDILSDNETNRMQAEASIDANEINKTKTLGEIEDKAIARNQAKADKQAQSDSGNSEFINLKQTIKSALDNPALNISPIARKSVAWSPTLSAGSDAYKLIEDLKTIRANTFLSKIATLPGGMTGLTEAEGAKFSQSFQSTDEGLDSKTLRKNLNTVLMLGEKANRAMNQRLGTNPLATKETRLTFDKPARYEEFLKARAARGASGGY